ncbi:MAG: glycoside hydrolase family 3 C-terminal domain-containing protein [Candidatus Limivivens sp.]|nr:glycoside hydrolase family 3 C-terminal domain-containing protein [Candidatus Limivivens sp.]
MIRKNRGYSGTTSNEISQRELDNRKIAREAAAEGIVLLKNEGALPVSKETPVALFGSGARYVMKGGSGSGDVNQRCVVSIEEGFRNAGYQIASRGWLDAYDQVYTESRLAWKEKIETLAKELAKENGEERGMIMAYSQNPYKAPAGRKITREDVEEAKTDTALYIVSRTAGEGADRHQEKGDYYLSGEEYENLKEVAAQFSNTIVVLNTGGMMDLSFMEEIGGIKGLIFLSQPGMEGGNALADVVSGVVTPSGKLTDTWAAAYEDYPSYDTYSHNNGNLDTEYYREGIFVGYRYFDRLGKKPAYEFGYGLSYTTFEVTGNVTALEKEDVTVEALVKNTGDMYSGKEVVQIYVEPPKGKLEKEVQRLAAFAKTDILAPGETQKLAIRFSLRNLTSYSEKQASYILEPGNYVVKVGNSSRNTAGAAVLSLDREIVTEKLRNICPLQEAFTEDSLPEAARETDFSALPVWKIAASEIETVTVDYERETGVSEEAKAIAARMTPEEMVSLTVGAVNGNRPTEIGNAAITVPGAAGETTPYLMEKYGVSNIAVADGPAGIRLSKHYQVAADGTIYKQDILHSLEGGFFAKTEWHEDAEDYYQYCTAMPVGHMVAQTWNPQLIEKVGHAVGVELEEFGITLWLAPGMNIHRNPLCGRNFEYYSEDPVISGIMAAAMTRGVQRVPGVGTTIKHFACNNQEDNRFFSDSVLSERALREIYLKGFEIAVKTSRPMSIMTSYNLVNGIHTANSYDLCTLAARKEWGFTGIIMSDWQTTKRGSDAAVCMQAGNDLIMPGTPDDRQLILDSLEGKGNILLKPEDLRRCTENMIQLIFDSNQYEECVSYLDKFDNLEDYFTVIRK